VIKPRDYQLEAARWALGKGRAVVCMPTGTGKTLIAALWIEGLLSKGRARRVLVLEPTRFMVEQTALFLRRTIGIPASPVHGSLPRSARRAGLQSPVVVATPEIMLWEAGDLLERFDAVVVDECHHTTGKDAYLQVMERVRAPYRLGLTAFIPEKRRRELENYIGEIKCWGWDDPRIAKYLPEWAGEVYEAELNSAERRLYDELERLWDESHGRDRVLLGNALRWLARDGAESLRETYRKPGTRLRRILEPVEHLLFHPEVRPAHKLEALKRILDDHEGYYSKAIVFVDRVIIAEIIRRELEHYDPVLILGRRWIEPHTSILKARRPESRLIIATSAGEEGIDLPEADLLVIWSNVASPLRFIQRLGRILRPHPERGRQKYAAFIVTPDTVDIDSLLDGIILAEKAGVKLRIDVSTVKYLWGLSRRRRVLEIIEEKPMTEDLIAQALQAPSERVRDALRWLLRHGLAGYIYTGIGRVYYSLSNPHPLREEYREYLTPSPHVEATVTPLLAGNVRARSVRGTVSNVRPRLHRMLEREKMFEGVRASVRARVNRGLEVQLNLSYNYPVSTREILDIIIDNVFSADKIARERRVIPGGG